MGRITNPKTLRKHAQDRNWEVGDGLTPEPIEVANYNAPSEPLTPVPLMLTEETIERLPGDEDKRPTVYDSLPTAN
jgi:hypothetical protein